MKPRHKPMHLWSPNLWQRRQDTQWRKDNLFNKWCWENWTVCYRMKLEQSVTPCTKINSKRIKDLNVRPDNVKLSEKSIDWTLWHKLQQDLFFSDSSPRVIRIETKINKWDLIKLKSFYTTKKAINKVKRQPSEWEKIFANEATGKGLISKIYK